VNQAISFLVDNVSAKLRTYLIRTLLNFYENFARIENGLKLGSKVEINL
jgi:hypothetical protein